MADNEEKLAREQIEANKLVEQQRSHARDQIITNSFDTAKPPSRFAYMVFSIFSGLIDILDFFELGADATGVGLIVVILLDIVIAAIFITLGYFASGKIQKMHKAAGDAAKTRNSLTPEDRLTNRINPFNKVLRNSILQIIPIIDLWPWQFMAARALYKAHQEAYEETLALKQQYEQGQGLENSLEEQA